MTLDLKPILERAELVRDEGVLDHAQKHLGYERTSGNQVVLTFNREPTETEAHDIYSTVGGWLSAWFDIYKLPPTLNP